MQILEFFQLCWLELVKDTRRSFWNGTFTVLVNKDLKDGFAGSSPGALYVSSHWGAVRAQRDPAFSVWILKNSRGSVSLLDRHMTSARRTDRSESTTKDSTRGLRVRGRRAWFLMNGSVNFKVFSQIYHNVRQKSVHFMSFDSCFYLEFKEKWGI